MGRHAARVSGTKRQHQQRVTALSGAAGAVIIAGAVGSLQAATYTYTPAGTSDQWSAGTNWSAVPVSAADTRLTIVGNNATVIADGQASIANNDIAGNFLLNILDLQGTGPATTDASITLSGNPLEFVVNGADNPVINLNAVDGAQDLDYTVANNLVLTNNTTLAGSGTSAFNLSGAISGGGSLTKTGGSTAVLSNVNTYSGGTVVSGGTLRATQVAALPGYNAAGQVVVNTATLSVNGGGAGEWVEADIDTLRANATFNAGAILGINVDTGNIFSYASNIANPIALTKSGGGTLVLGGTNTYTGNTTVAGGTLQSTAAANIPGYNVPGRVVVGGTLRLVAGTGAWTSSELDAVVANATFNSGSTLHVEVTDAATISANITAPIALAKSNVGTLTLTGTNTYSGNTSLSGGTLAVTDGTQLGGGQLNLGNAANPVTLQVNGALATITNPTIMMDGNSTGPVTVAGAGAINFTGTFKNSESNGVINVTNSGSTTFSGAVHLSDSASNRTLRIGGAGNVTISGVVSNGTAGSTASQLTYQGSGTLTLTGANLHTNRTNVASGTVAYAANSAFGTSTVWLGTSTTTGTLQVNPGTFTNNIVVDSSNTANTSGVIAGSSAVTFSGSVGNDDTNGRLEVNNTALTTFAGPVNLSTTSANRNLRFSGSGDVLITGLVDEGPAGSTASSFFYQGTGTLTLNNANTHAGNTTVASGTLAIANDAALGSSTLNIGNNTANAIVRASGGPRTIANNATLGSSDVFSGIIGGSDNFTINGSFSNGNSHGYLRIDNTALTTFAGPVYLSNNLVNARTLHVIGGGAAVMSGGVSDANGIGLANSLAYEGTGSLTVSGAAGYTGTTAVASGLLRLQTNLTTSSSVGVTGGTLELAAGGGSNRVIKTPAVAVTGAGRIDLKDNKLITASPLGTWSGSAYTEVSGLVDSGRGNNSNAQWDGTSGIVTSDTRAVNNNDLVSIGTATVANAKSVADTATTTFAGQTVLGSDSIALVTWGGDANLDGKINVDDYGQIDFNVGSSGSVFGWYNGDFNYDGKINVDDYGIIDFNVVAQSGTFPTSGATSVALDGVTAVPEPSTLSLVALGACGLVRRRRRSRCRRL